MVRPAVAKMSERLKVARSPVADSECRAPEHGSGALGLAAGWMCERLNRIQEVFPSWIENPTPSGPTRWIR
jgi:hypothetical protein